VKVDDQTPGSGPGELECMSDRGQERQREHHARGAHQQVSERQAPRDGGRGVDERGECPAQVRTEDERESTGRLDDVCGGERRHEQHDGDARVACPGECRRDQRREDGVAGQRAHDRAQQRSVLQGSQRVHQARERHQHEPEADADAADILRPAASGPAEKEHADEHQGWPQQGHVEEEHLRQERSTNVGAEHDRECGGEPDHAGRRERGREQTRRRAALEKRGHAQSGQECAEAVTEVATEPASEHRAEAALHPGADHVRAPEEEAHMAREFDK
jgi:hypothetical protein